MQENLHDTWKDATVASFLDLKYIGLSLIQRVKSKEATNQRNNSM